MLGSFLVAMAAASMTAGALDVDPRLIGRPPTFDGSEAAWQDWAFQTRAYLEVIDNSVAEALELVDVQVGAIEFARLSAANKGAARRVYYILTQLLKGPALLELCRVERGNGLECWRLLQARYERGTTSRLAATLQSILRPSKFPEDSLGFENALKDWELTVTRWESMAGEKLNDQVKRQILQEQAPHGIRMQLLLQNFIDYDDMRTTVLNFVVTSRDWAKTLGKQQNPNNAMDVDAITKGGFKGGKGQQKGKSKQKGGKQDKETRECWVCGKTGHLFTDCWHRDGAQKGVKGKGKDKGKHKHRTVQEVSGAVSSVSSAGPSASTAHPPGLAAHIEMLGLPEAPYDEGWIMPVQAPQTELEELYDADWLDEVCAGGKRDLEGQALGDQWQALGDQWQGDLEGQALGDQWHALGDQWLKRLDLEPWEIYPSEEPSWRWSAGPTPGPCGPGSGLEVMSVSSVTVDDTGALILVDSGAACHVCPKNWMLTADTTTETGLVLKTASGARMRHYGKRTVKMRFAGVRGEGTATFEATDVRHPIFSAGRLAESGHVVVLRAGDPHILRPTGEKMPLEMHNGLPYLRAVAVGTVMTSRSSSDPWCESWIAPVDEPMPPAAGVEPLEPPLAAPRPQALVRDDMQPGIVPARGLKVPAIPSPAEVAEHELTHMPAKPWCEHCIRGRGRDEVHSKTDHVDQVVPVIEMDYYYLTEKPEKPDRASASAAAASAAVADEEEKNSQTCLVAVCRSTGYLFSTVVTEKGPGCSYAVAAMCSWLHELGHSRFILQSDGEPALVALRDAVRAKYLTSSAQGVVEHISCRVSPVGSHGSNGGAERAVQMVRGLARVYIDSVRAKTGATTLDAKSPWWTWAVRHAAWVYNRFNARPDLRCTPYTKLKWRVYAQPMVPFGELVLSRRPGAHLHKAESWFVYGAWVGRDGRTDEHLVLTKAGVVRSRAVRRLTPDRCWSTMLVDVMKRTP